MGFIKCPRCELNYIKEEEQYCSVCKREMKGEVHEDPFELCSICNENPVMPGKDVCPMCYKEMNQQQGLRDDSVDRYFYRYYSSAYYYIRYAADQYFRRYDQRICYCSLSSQ